MYRNQSKFHMKIFISFRSKNKTKLCQNKANVRKKSFFFLSFAMLTASITKHFYNKTDKQIISTLSREWISDARKTSK